VDRQIRAQTTRSRLRPSSRFVQLAVVVALTVFSTAVSRGVVGGSESSSGRNWGIGSAGPEVRGIPWDDAIRVAENGLSEQTNRRVEFS
jgi:hypothetical protein